MKSKLILTLMISLGLFMNTQAQWVQLGSGADPLSTSGLYPTTLCTDASGTLYAAGRFKDIGGAQYVAKWNGSSWVELGTGNFALNASDYIMSICCDPSGNVYAAGKFKISGGIFAYVAKWNGTSWSEVGAGQNLGLTGGYIQDFTSICADATGNIYAVGNITDNTAANYEVSKWDGTNWTEVGTLNANSTVNTIAVDGSNIYVGGVFTNGANSGVGHPYVAKWNGSSWSELGAGSGALNASDVINVIDVDASHNVYVGGEFQDLASHKYIAKWNGSAWSELGGAASMGQSLDVGGVYTIIHDASGNIYAAGGMLDGNNAEFVGKWNGSSWSNYGNLHGDNFVDALATYGTKMYATGHFRNSSSNPYVAKYDPTTGINDVTVATSTIAPNPTTGICTIAFEKPTTATITLTDLTGQTLEVLQSENSNSMTCNLSHYATGLYIIRIESSIGQSQILKVVKQ